MKCFSKSVWILAAAIGAGESRSQGHALTSGSPAVKYVMSPPASHTARAMRPNPDSSMP